jgi:hypothetical protein
MDHQVGYRRLEASREIVPQAAKALRHGGLFVHGQLGGPAEGDSTCHVLRSRPDAELLAATMEDGFDSLPVAHY